MDIPIQILTTNHLNGSAHQDLSIDASIVSLARPVQKLFSLKWDWNGTFTATIDHKSRDRLPNPRRWTQRRNDLGGSTTLGSGPFEITLSNIGRLLL